MKFLRVSLALSLASAACVGSINGDKPGSTNTPGTNSPPGSNNNTNPNLPPGSGEPPTNPPPVSVGTCNETTLAKPRAWRLTHAQVRNSLRDTFGFAPKVIDSFPVEARIDSNNSRNGFANSADELKISPLLADFYYKASEELAGEVVAKGNTFGLGCQVTGLASGDCLKTFIKNFGLKMWRRPLADAEVSKLSTLFTTASGQGAGAEGGLKVVVQAMFLSPNFLYRSEIGHTQDAGKITYLTEYELASALSYALWDSAPDAELLDLASKGKLRDKGVLVEQAKRLMGSKEKSLSAMTSFVEQWLHTEDVGDADKELTMFSLGTKQIGHDLVEETKAFLNSVLYDGDKSFKTLFTANYGFVNGRTAALYGIEGVTGDALVKKEMDPAQRRGLLTQGAFMWGHANPDGTHPVERGRYFREEILCEGVPDPPPTVLIDPQFGDATLTARERLAIHLKEPACAGCHALIDGLGLSMENYDAIGRYRTEETVKDGVKKPIDPTGTVALPSDKGATIQFKNFIELIDQLAKKPDVYSCFASQYLDYTMGLKPGALDECERRLVTEEFVKSGYKIDALVLGAINSPSFMARKN
jgi:Protein of unknown function (DUF1592)/Protein of unknown function (DUF1588)/Protein of unknown function (DUF1595)/Protein of unknown function (DUF1587)/Protein of unknown function (DUF1585)